MNRALTLAVNCVQSKAQLVLFSENAVFASKQWDKKGSHSEVITQAFDDLLNENSLTSSDIKSIDCVVGPGSFTGIRVAVNFCRSLAYSLSIPVRPLNALDLLAAKVPETGPIVSVIDAQKNSLFCSFYQNAGGKLEAVEVNQVYQLSTFSKKFDQAHWVAGSGLEHYWDHISDELKDLLNIRNEWSDVDLEALSVQPNFFANIDLVPWSQLEPLYLKASAPEEKKSPSAK